MGELYRIFPKEEWDFWEKAFRKQEEMTEMRLRIGKPAFVYCGGKEYLLGGSGELCPLSASAKGDALPKGVCFDRDRLERLLLHLCRYSMYAYEEELREGYLTLEGGHRLGVAGQVVIENGRIRTIKNIAFLNLRIAHQVLGAADAVLPYVYRDGQIKNTLIVSPPGCGKTTLLRDLVRQISAGNPYGRGKCVGVVDERSEIAGSYMGIPQNELGPRTDVMDGCPKAIGILLLIRSMAPDVLAVDEIGGENDMEAIRQAATCGISVIATAHGRDREDIRKRNLHVLFEEFLFLDHKGASPRAEEYPERSQSIDKTDRGCHGVCGLHGNGSAVYLLPKQTYPAAGGAAGGDGAYRRRDTVQQGDAAGMFSAMLSRSGN